MNVAVDPEAERAVLATLLLYPRRFDEVATALQPEDFSAVGHVWLFDAMRALVAEHGTFDVVMLRDVANDEGALLSSLIGDTPSVSLLSRHVERVARTAVARRMIHRLADASSALQEPSVDPAEVLDTLTAAVEEDRYVGGLPPGYGLFYDWANTAQESPRPWVIPGVIRRTGRVIVVAAEGVGKSTLGRQVAVCTAAGRHPFRWTEMEPRRVLVVDAENDPSTAYDEQGTVDQGSPLGLVKTADRFNPEWDRANLAVWSRPEGIDIRSRRDAAWLESAIADFRPDLIVAGPLYKMFRRARNEDDETLGAALQTIFDRLRTRYDTGLWLEHHAPKGQNGVRPLDPFGTSLWRRWPDIGVTMTLQDDGTVNVGRFRQDRYSVTGIPLVLERGATWPWRASGLG